MISLGLSLPRALVRMGGGRVLGILRTPQRLLLYLTSLPGILSARLVNDTICIMLTPLGSAFSDRCRESAELKSNNTKANYNGTESRRPESMCDTASSDRAAALGTARRKRPRSMKMPLEWNGMNQGCGPKTWLSNDSKYIRSGSQLFVIRLSGIVSLPAQSLKFIPFDAARAQHPSSKRQDISADLFIVGSRKILRCEVRQKCRNSDKSEDTKANVGKEHGN